MHLSRVFQGQDLILYWILVGVEAVAVAVVCCTKSVFYWRLLFLMLQDLVPEEMPQCLRNVHNDHTVAAFSCNAATQPEQELHLCLPGLPSYCVALLRGRYAIQEKRLITFLQDI